MQALIRYLLLPALVGALVGLAVLRLVNGRGDNGTAQPGYADAVASAAQSVVNIYSSKIVRTRLHPICETPRYRDLCESLAGPTQRMQNSLGSGVIVRSDGYILTNAHVIADADEILVAFIDGHTATANVVGTDPETDLAVIQVGEDALDAISLGSSDQTRVGDVVLAIGNPFGIGQTVSMGIISAKGRYNLTSSPYEDFIQTDAAINPGNSGGALIDTRGRLVGINSLIFSQTSQGIGFAIPAKLAMTVLEEIIREGRVIRGYLGIEVSSLPNASNGMGLVVANVIPGSPADEAGLQSGDVIVSVNDQPAVNSRVVTRQIAMTEPGTDIALSIVRNGERLELNAVAGVRPPAS